MITRTAAVGLVLPLLLLGQAAFAFHLAPRVSTAAAGVHGGSPVLSTTSGGSGQYSSGSRLSQLLMKAMRIPGLPTPAAKGPKAAMLWVVPPFLRNLPFVGGGAPRLRARTSLGAGKQKRVGRPLAAAPSSSLSDVPTSSYYSYQQESGPVQAGTLEGGAAGIGGAEIHGPEADTVPIVIKYTGGVGFKSVFVGCVRVLKEHFPNISIRKTIVAPTEQRGSKKNGLFEVVVGDETFSSKRGEGVYLPMADIAAAIDRLALKRDKERRAAAAALAAAAQAAAQAAAEEAAAAAAAAQQEE